MSFVDARMIYAILAVYFATSVIAIPSYYIAKHKPIYNYSQNISAIIYMFLTLSLILLGALKKQKCTLGIRDIIIVLKTILKLSSIWVTLFCYFEVSGKALNIYWIIAAIFAQAYINILVILNMSNNQEEIDCPRQY